VLENIDYRAYPILFVDDEEDSRTVFQITCDDEFTTLIAPDGPSGLAMLKEHPATPIIVADERMPEMKGTDFLEQVQEHYPKTIRIIMTAYSSFEVAYNAINKGKVYRYLTKPWEPEQLKTELRQAIQQYCLREALKREVEEKTRALEKLKKTQAMLVQTEKLSIIGELTTSFAHEIRNPLAIISGNAEFQLKKLVGGLNKEQLTDALREIVDQSERVSEIIDRIRGFAKPSKAELQVVNIGEVINNSLAMVNHEVSVSGVEIQKKYGEGDNVLGDKLQLEQVFVNLIRNAIEAMKRKGRLTFTAEPARDGAMVSIRVIDTGPGIPEEELNKLFEIFYTTKERGTGVGLFISNQIIQSLGGQMTVTSQPSAGTTFTITLPRAQ